MAHGTQLDAGSGGDEIVTVDLALGTYPTGEDKLPATCLYVSVNATTAPTPVTAANALYVQPGTSVTFPISAASLPLPSGASTAAKQPALGTAGSASADVITVQGIASGTPLAVSGTVQAAQSGSWTVAATQSGSWTVAQSGTWNVGTVTTVTTVSTVTAVSDASVQGKAAHDSAVSGNPVRAAAYASAAAPSDVSGDGDTVNLWALRNGALAVNLTAAGALIPGDASNGLTVNLGGNNDVTVTGSVTANAGTNLNTSALALESGGNLAAIATDAAAIEVLLGTIDADTGTLAGVVTSNRAAVNPISGQAGVSGGSGTVDATTQRVCLATDVALPAGTNLLGSAVPAASATVTGLDTVFDADGDNTAQVCKASAGRLYGIEVSNPNSADAYLQLFDLATGSVTVGVTTPKLSFFVPAGDGTKDGAMDKVFPVPITFATAITYACTTTATGSGDPTTGLVVNLLYK